MVYSLQKSAEVTGKSKATIWRAVKKGLISATRHDDGTLTVEPVELHRVFPPLPLDQAETLQDRLAMGQGKQPAIAEDTARNALEVENARLKAEISGLREIVRLHREQVEDLRDERNKLIGQIEASTRLLTHDRSVSEAKRGFWSLFNKR